MTLGLDRIKTSAVESPSLFLFMVSVEELGITTEVFSVVLIFSVASVTLSSRGKFFDSVEEAFSICKSAVVLSTDQSICDVVSSTLPLLLFDFAVIAVELSVVVLNDVTSAAVVDDKMVEVGAVLGKVVVVVLVDSVVVVVVVVVVVMEGTVVAITSVVVVVVAASDVVEAVIVVVSRTLY